MDIIPSNYVLEEILKFLPVKSLLRFRSVQKSWNSLITSPDFKILHYKYNLQLQSHTNDIDPCHDTLLVTNGVEVFTLKGSLSSDVVVEPFLHPLPTQDQDDNDVPAEPLTRIKFTDIVYGLVLIPKSSTFMLWNPATGVSNHLPVPDPIPIPEYLKLTNPYPCLSDYVYPMIDLQGFWFDPRTEHFKVVDKVWWYRDSDSVGFVRLYSSKTASWKIIPAKFHLLPKCSISHRWSIKNPPEWSLIWPDEAYYDKAYFDGKFYWIAAETKQGSIHLHSLVSKPMLVIIAFDFETEEFKVTPVPETIIPGSSLRIISMNLLVHIGSLTLCKILAFDDATICEIWSMVGEDEEGMLLWEKKSWISLNWIYGLKVLPRALKRLMNGERGIVLELTTYSRHNNPKLCLYDPSSGTWKDLDVPPHRYLPFSALTYVDSLFSTVKIQKCKVKSIDEADWKSEINSMRAKKNEGKHGSKFQVVTRKISRNLKTLFARKCHSMLKD